MNIFEYPIEVTNEMLKNEIGLDLIHEYGSAGMTVFLNNVHAAVYEGCIYATGDRTIKDKIIRAHIGAQSNAILRALILQAQYMHDEGNVGTESGITITADGQKAVVGKNELRSKNICIAALDALKSCSYPILYAGEY